MIKIEVLKEKDFIKNINISGHAHYAESGRDIVCSAVSSIVITTVNAALTLDKDSVRYNDTKGMRIEILKETDTINKLFQNMIDLLKELEKDYQKNIKFI